MLSTTGVRASREYLPAASSTLLPNARTASAASQRTAKEPGSRRDEGLLTRACAAKRVETPRPTRAAGRRVAVAARRRGRRMRADIVVFCGRLVA